MYSADQDTPLPDVVRIKRLAKVLSAWNDFRDFHVTGMGSFDFAERRVFHLFDAMTRDLANLPFSSVCMPNFGNTCHINAVLQALMHCEPLRWSLASNLTCTHRPSYS